MVLAVTLVTWLTKRSNPPSGKLFIKSHVVLMLSMGAKVQTENTKLNVPGAGSYESPSKVSRHA